MRYARTTLWITAFAASLSLMACGLDRPTHTDVENNINNPTGNVDSKTATGAISGYNAQNSSGGVTGSYVPKFLRAAGKPMPLYTYLANAGVPQNLIPTIAGYIPNNDDYSLRNDIGQSTYGSLSAKQFGGISIPGCFSISGSVDGEAREGEISINLKCTAQGSGTLVVRFRGWQQRADVMSGEIEVIFRNTCDKSNACVDGSLSVKAETKLGAKKDGKVVYAYHLRASNDGKSVQSKGGFRLSYTTENQSGKIEVCAFLSAEDQESGAKGEASVVIVFEKQGSLNTFSVRGKNGTFECTSSDNGRTGKCAGTGSAAGEFTWASKI